MKRNLKTGSNGMSGSFALMLCIMLSLLLGGCAARSRTTGTETGKQLSGKFTPYAYREDGTRLFIGVDTYAAHFTKKGSLFPIGLGLANHGMGSAAFNRESFILESSSGRAYPVATNAEFAKDHNRSRSDLRLADSFLQSMRMRFRNYSLFTWNLFPVKGTANITNSLVLPRNTWTFTYLYFPVPPEGFHGQDFTLLVRTEDPDETYIVRFAVD